MRKILNLMVVITILVAISACGNNNRERNNNAYAKQLTLCQQKAVDYENEIRELTTRISEYEKMDSAIAAEDGLIIEVEKHLEGINLSALGILPMWSGMSVTYTTEVITSNPTLDGGFRWAVIDIFQESGYSFLRKSFIANPIVWQKVFLTEQEQITWFKKRFNLPVVNQEILPYLKDEYSSDGFKKEYLPAFKKFYAIHSVSSTEGVWNHPQWDEFENTFFKQFPDAFGGNSSNFAKAYKLWRTSYTIPQAARKVLANVIEQYNAL
jgi:hypothetical protein